MARKPPFHFWSPSVWLSSPCFYVVYYLLVHEAAKQPTRRLLRPQSTFCPQYMMSINCVEVLLSGSKRQSILLIHKLQIFMNRAFNVIVQIGSTEVILVPLLICLMVLIMLQAAPGSCSVLQWTCMINGWLDCVKNCQSLYFQNVHCFLTSPLCALRQFLSKQAQYTFILWILFLYSYCLFLAPHSYQAACD